MQRGGKEIDRIKKYLKKNRILIVCALLINVVSAVLVMIIPLITGRLFDKLILAPKMSIVYRFCIYLLIATVFSLIIGYIGAVISTKLKTKMSFEMNYDMLSHIQDISMKVSGELQPAYVNNRINSDVNSVISFILELITNSTINIIKLIVLMAYFVFINYKMALIIVFLDLFYVFIFLGLKERMENIKIKIKESGNRYYVSLQDQISNIKFLKVFSLKNYFYKRLTSGYQSLYVNLRANVNLECGLKSSEAFVQMLSQMAIFIIGGFGMINGTMTVGVFTVLLSYLQMIIGCTDYFVSIGNVFVDTKIAYLRLKEFQDIPTVPEGEETIDSIESVEFDDVSFGYTTDIISHFSYTFIKGVSYALCGNNGAGKTTMVDLLAGLYARQYDGCIYLNQKDLDSLNTAQIRNRLMTYCMQKSEILEGDFRFNLLIDREGDDKDYLNYLIHGFQLEYLLKDDNLNKQISVDTVSGGEAQKISLIRALLNTQSELYIFDEPTNNLDRNSQIFFESLLNALKERAIVIIVTHDKSLLSMCDEVIEL